MMESELKPVRCGCGGEAYAHLIGNSDAKGYYICCEECGIRTEIFETLTEAAKAWEKAFAKDINVPAKERTYKVTDIHVDEYYCPACGAEIPHSHEDKGDNYCRECGARLEWE